MQQFAITIMIRMVIDVPLVWHGEHTVSLRNRHRSDRTHFGNDRSQNIFKKLILFMIMPVFICIIIIIIINKNFAKKKKKKKKNL